MKLKKIMAFLLVFMLVLGALPLAAFAVYEAPSIEDVTTAIAGETNAGIVYASDLEGVSVTVNEASTNTNTSSTLTKNNEVKGTYFSKLALYDQYSNGDNKCINVYAKPDGSGILWKSHVKDMSQTSDDNNCLDITLTSQPAGKSIVLSFDITMYEDAFTENVLFRTMCKNNSALNYTFIYIEKNTGNLVPFISGNSRPDVVLAELNAEDTVNIALHIKPMASENGGYGSIVFDVYVNGVIKGENLLAFPEATLKTKGAYASAYIPSYFRIANSVGEIMPYGLTCVEEDHSACTDECPYNKDLYSLDSVRIYYSDECYETVHGTADHAYTCKRVDESTHAYTCSCGKTLDPETHTINSYGYCELCDADITEVSVTIDQDLALKYYASISEDLLSSGEALSMRFGSTIVNEYTCEGGKYIFKYDGIGPHQVANEITAVLYLGDKAIASETYSVEKYCRKALELYPDDTALVQLIHDLLIYAQAAEAYNNGTNNIAKDMILNPSSYAPSEDDANITKNGNENTELYVYSAGVKFDTVNSIFFKIKASSNNFTVTVGDSTYNGSMLELTDDGYYIVYSAPIEPLNFGQSGIQKITLVNSDNATVAELSYTVNNYAYYMQSNSAMETLAIALYRYGKSCVKYAVPAISYVLNDGNNPQSAPEVYDAESGTALPTPTKDGYVFAGWYAEEDFSGEKLTVIGKDQKGEITVYARWYKILTDEDYSATSLNISATTKKVNTITYNGDRKTGSSFITTEDTDGNKYLVWTQGTSDPFINVREGFIASASEHSISYEIKIAKNGADFMTTEATIRIMNTIDGAELSNSDTTKIRLFKTIKNTGKIYLGGSTDSSMLLGQITEDNGSFTIRVTVDFEKGTVIGYKEDGTSISYEFTPGYDATGATTTLEYQQCAGTRGHDMYWGITTTNATVGNTDSMIVNSIKITEGNIFEN